MPDSNAWFYSVNQQPLGPVSYEQILQLIRDRVIQPTTFLWHEGLTSWQPAQALIPDWPAVTPGPAHPPSLSTVTPAPQIYAPQPAYGEQAPPMPDWSMYPPQYDESHFTGPFRTMVIWFIIGMVVLLVGAVMIGVGAATADMHHRRNDFPAEILPGLAILALGIGGLIISTVYQMILLYRCWNLITDINPSVSPGLAVGLLFVPLFNLYWIFRAYMQLSKELNRYLRARGIVAQQSSEGISLTYCILCLCGWIPYLGYLASLANLVFFFVMFADFKRTAVAIADWQHQQVPYNENPRRF